MPSPGFYLPSHILPSCHLHGLQSHLVWGANYISGSDGGNYPSGWDIGINVYVGKGVVRDVHLETILKGALPFLIALILTSLILLPFPQIALFLPAVMKVVGKKLLETNNAVVTRKFL